MTGAIPISHPLDRSPDRPTFVGPIFCHELLVVKDALVDSFKSYLNSTYLGQPLVKVEISRPCDSPLHR